jgi:N-methylhydantoinase A
MPERRRSIPYSAPASKRPRGVSLSSGTVRNVRVGIDVGGTFTDVVVLRDDSVSTAKVPSTPDDQSAGVLRALLRTGVTADAVAVLAHGTTVATNALLERRGARTALVTTHGFRDVIEIGRQNRPSLYDLTMDRPPPLVPRERRITVRERMGPSGEVQELDASAVEAAVDDLEEASVSSIAVCLLFGFLHPEHERKLGDAIRGRLRGVHVSVSSDVLPEFREYERLSTTVANAYLAPELGAYLESLATIVRDRGYPPPLVMQSSGGVLDVEAAAELPAACLLSGPAAGVVGAARAAGLSGYRDALSFDMGGTSTDVAAIVDGAVETTTSSVVAGVPIGFPAIDVHTVSAGGGSVAWVDDGGALRVGPRSAGARPGPAAYGAGGRDATVTDANVVLGYLADGARLGEDVVLRRTLAERAIGEIAAKLGADVAAAARGVVDVANAEMVRALRVVTIERGADPRSFALLAFGGAGPMHACGIADELDIATVVVPRAGGVLSALGLAISDLRRDYVVPSLRSVSEATAADLSRAYEAMRSRAERDLASPRIRRLADARYRGQSFELTVAAGTRPEELEEAFHRAHESRYGYRMRDEAVEIVSLRLAAFTGGAAPELSEAPAGGNSQTGVRGAWFDGARHDVPTHDRTRMGAGSHVAGPAVVEYPETTCVVPPGWRGAVDATGNLVLVRA